VGLNVYEGSEFRVHPSSDPHRDSRSGRSCTGRTGECTRTAGPGCSSHRRSRSGWEQLPPEHSAWPLEDRINMETLAFSAGDCMDLNLFRSFGSLCCNNDRQKTKN